MEKKDNIIIDISDQTIDEICALSGENHVKTYTSGSKPRYDGEGCLFGDLHRELPKNICMMDMDSYFCLEEMDFSIENERFIEYRHQNDRIVFRAIFEIKHKFIQRAIDIKQSVVKAQIALVTSLNLYNRYISNSKILCKLFVVFQTEGRQPLTFYEFSKNRNAFEKIYYLQFSNNDKKRELIKCWRYLGLLD